MDEWQKMLAAGLIRPEELVGRYPADTGNLQKVVQRFPMRISPYYLSLIHEPGDPIWLQCVPDVRELEPDGLQQDPLNETGLSPVPTLIHRYPDRAVWLVSSSCATLCRFCMRKHQNPPIEINSEASHDEVIEYLSRTTAIRDVVLSGGDPLLLSDADLSDILEALHGIRHIEMVRVHTRVPVTLPQRITRQLCQVLKRHHPLYVNIHFNHPSEITDQSAQACSMLADAGIPLGNQTVLLKGVNDDPLVMRSLMQKLLTLRVRPYYIHQADLVTGTRHFHVPVSRGIEIMAALRGHTSGLAVPAYMIDLPGGKGKVQVLPDAVERQGGTLVLRNYQGEVVEYDEQ